MATKYNDYYGGTAKAGSSYDKKMQEYGAKLKPKQSSTQKAAMREIISSVKQGASEAAKKHSILGKTVEFGKRITRGY